LLKPELNLFQYSFIEKKNESQIQLRVQTFNATYTRNDKGLVLPEDYKNKKDYCRYIIIIFNYFLLSIKRLLAVF